MRSGRTIGKKWSTATRPQKHLTDAEYAGTRVKGRGGAGRTRQWQAVSVVSCRLRVFASRDERSAGAETCALQQPAIGSTRHDETTGTSERSQHAPHTARPDTGRDWRIIGSMEISRPGQEKAWAR